MTVGGRWVGSGAGPEGRARKQGGGALATPGGGTQWEGGAVSASGGTVAGGRQAPLGTGGTGTSVPADYQQSPAARRNMSEDVSVVSAEHDPGPAGRAGNAPQSSGFPRPSAGVSVRLRHFPDISPIAWEHPSDTAALAALRAIPGVERAIGATLGRVNELAAGRRLLRGSTPVTVESSPRAFRVWAEVGRTLDAPELPPLHVRKMGGVNAATTGMDRPVVLVSAEAVEQLHDGTLRAVLAHELGHILSGHIRYKTAWMVLATMGVSALPAVWTIPLYAGAFAAFRAWDRASELSADRASLLATGDVDMLAAPLAGHDPKPPSRRLAGLGPRFRWAAAVGPALDRGWTLFQAHPPSATRLAALRDWERSDDYRAVLEGRYARRGDERKTAGRWLEARSSLLREGLSQALDRVRT